MAVSKKHSDETRHQTALRYIKSMDSDITMAALAAAIANALAIPAVNSNDGKSGKDNISAREAIAANAMRERFRTALDALRAAQKGVSDE